MAESAGKASPLIPLARAWFRVPSCEIKEEWQMALVHRENLQEQVRRRGIRLKMHPLQPFPVGLSTRGHLEVLIVLNIMKEGRVLAV